MGNFIDAHNHSRSKNRNSIIFTCSRENAFSLGLNRTRNSSFQKNKSCPEAQNQNECKQEENQEYDASTKKTYRATSIASSLEIDEKVTAVAPEVTDASSYFYQYRDFSNVPGKEAEEGSKMISNCAMALIHPGPRIVRVKKFPLKLYAILAEERYQDIISWMPHGRSWIIRNPDLFESLIMPIFFEKSNYHSFNRLVSAWNFRRVTVGIDRGSYFNEFFLRGKPNLLKYMRRLPKTQKKLPMKQEEEPDFYAMDKQNPLPFCNEATFPLGTNKSMDWYQAPYGAVSWVLPIQMPIQMQMHIPMQLQPRNFGMDHVYTVGFGKMNGTRDFSEVSWSCGAGSAESSMCRMEVPATGSSKVSPVVPPKGNYNCLDDMVGNTWKGMNVLGDGLELGMDIDGSNAIGSFDMEQLMVEDGAWYLY